MKELQQANRELLAAVKKRDAHRAKLDAAEIAVESARQKVERLALRGDHGRLRMSSESAARCAVGSAVQTSTGEWLRIQRVESIVHRDEDGEHISTTWVAVGRHVTAQRAGQINDRHGPALSGALHAATAERVAISMPSDAAVLIARDTTSLAATGERVALDGPAILHERTGDPDQIDSWHHYVVRITDVDLVRRVRRFLAR